MFYFEIRIDWDQVNKIRLKFSHDSATLTKDPNFHTIQLAMLNLDAIFCGVRPH